MYTQKQIFACTRCIYCAGLSISEFLRETFLDPWRLIGIFQRLQMLLREVNDLDSVHEPL
ncbi:MAG: hypothetical protein JSC161_000055 [Candidatus Tokpelaia sp. JSC161]|nr:MAG: hypothetical protein JSC161_000055 [Candidatus Tokpelaia sp. JSC161]